MRCFLLFLSVVLLPLFASAKMVKDTINTRQNDKIILTYVISVSGDNVTFSVDNKPRIIPGDKLRKACKGDLERLKVVIFDRIGDFGKVKWKGISPTAFTVPSGLSYDKSNEGFYILGETTIPISFTKRASGKRNISFPLYIAVYEKKQTYKLITSSLKPLNVSVGRNTSKTSHGSQSGVETERIAIQSDIEIEADNEDIAKALSSMQMIRQMLETESEFPFSQTLQMEIFNLRTLKNNIKETDIIEKINDVLLLCNDKERELKDSQREASLADQAQEQALIAQQKADEEARQKEAEEKARIQEEKQQKRTLWMIIGGIILTILSFIGNAVFKHFRDVRNQKSIMEMQESLAKQAEHEARRRTGEIVRNKAHQVAQKGKSRVRESIQNTGKSRIRESIPNTGKSKNNSKIKSI